MNTPDRQPIDTTPAQPDRRARWALGLMAAWWLVFFGIGSLQEAVPQALLERAVLPVLGLLWPLVCLTSIGLAVSSLLLERRYPLLFPSARAMCGVAIALAVIMQLLLMLTIQINRQWEHVNCKSVQRTVAVQLLIAVGEGLFPATMPAGADRCHCVTHRLFPPFFPPIRKPIGYNTHLAGRKLADITDPTNTLLTADCVRNDRIIHGPADIDWKRHPGGCAITFVDGHVESVSSPEGIIFDPQ